MGCTPVGTVWFRKKKGSRKKKDTGVRRCTALPTGGWLKMTVGMARARARVCVFVCVCVCVRTYYYYYYYYTHRHRHRHRHTHTHLYLFFKRGVD